MRETTVDQMIERAEANGSFRFQDDFREFLRTFPRGVRAVCPMPGWRGVVDQPSRAVPLAQRQGDSAWSVLEDISSFLSQRGVITHYIGTHSSGDSELWNTRLMKHAYPVALSRRSRPIVQVARGKYAGQVVHAGSAYYDHLTDVVPDDDGDATWAVKAEWDAADEATTDRLVELLLGDGGGYRIATSFADLYRDLTRFHGAAEDRAAAEAAFVPTPGQAVAVSEEDGWRPLQALLRTPFSRIESAGIPIVGYSGPGVVVGSVTIDGDGKVAELPVGREGFVGPVAGGYVLVHGDLTIRGNLELDPECALFVTGDVTARTIYGSGATLVAEGTLSAEQLVCIHTPEGGGLYARSRAHAPMVIETSPGDIRLTAKGKPAFNNVEITLAHVLGEVTKSAVEAEPEALYQAVLGCIEHGIADVFRDTFLHRVVDVDDLTYRGVHLADLERGYGLTVHASYRDFVSAARELYGEGPRSVHPEQLMAWDGVSEASDGQPEPDDEGSTAYWLHDLASLMLPADVRAVVDEATLWSRPLLRHGYPIGKAYDGSLYVQSVGGPVFRARGDEWLEDQDHEELADLSTDDFFAEWGHHRRRPGRAAPLAPRATGAASGPSGRSRRP